MTLETSVEERVLSAAGGGVHVEGGGVLDDGKGASNRRTDGPGGRM